MKLLIDIPKEFEQHFKTDGFKDSLHRLSADAHLLAGNYEQETAVMLIETFASAVPISPHGRLIEESKVLDIVSEWCPDDDGSVGKYGNLREMLDEIEALPTIILADDKDINVPNKEDGVDDKRREI